MAPRCPVCNKFAYANESISVEGVFYHKACLKCCECHRSLSASNYKFHSPSQKIYCSIHYPKEKNLQAAVTMETLSAQENKRNGPGVENRNIQGCEEQRRNTGALSQTEISATKQKGTLYNKQIQGGEEQRRNCQAYDLNDIAASQQKGTLYNKEVQGGADQRRNCQTLGLADEAASHQKGTVVNEQIRGTDAGRRNCQTLGVADQHATQQKGTVINEQIRGNQLKSSGTLGLFDQAATQQKGEGVIQNPQIRGQR